MRTMILVFAALLVVGGVASAQQELAPSTDQGPLNIAPKAGPNQDGQAQGGQAQAGPSPVVGLQPAAPDSAGVYAAGPGVVSPIVLERIAATYPGDDPAGAIEGDTILSMVIGVDGTASQIKVVRSHGASFDDAATAALRQSKFDPGTVDGKPVPVRMFARVHFSADMRPAYPRTLVRFGQPTGTGQEGLARRPMRESGDTPPRVITTAEPEYTDAARKKKIQGVVTVSVLVNEEGIPVDPQIIHSVEPGLDENAMECALKYRFRPAMHAGAPVATRIAIQMSFKIY